MQSLNENGWPVLANNTGRQPRRRQDHQQPHFIEQQQQQQHQQSELLFQHQRAQRLQRARQLQLQRHQRDRQPPRQQQLEPRPLLVKRQQRELEQQRQQERARSRKRQQQDRDADSEQPEEFDDVADGGAEVFIEEARYQLGGLVNKLHPPGAPARNQSQKKAQKLSLEAQRRSLNVFENKEDVEMFLDTIGKHSEGNHRICTGGPNPLPQTDLYSSFWVELLPTGQKSPDLIDAFSSLDTKGRKVLRARLFPASKGSKRPAAAAAPLKLAEVALFGHYGLSFGDAFRDYYDRTKLAKTMVCLESLLASVFQRGVDDSGEGVAWMFIDPVHNKGPPNAGTVPKAEEQFATLGPLVTSLLEQGVPILVLSQKTSGYIRKMDCWKAAAKAPLPLGIPDSIGVECRQTTGGVWMMLAAHLTARETLAARGNVAAAFGAVLNAPLPMVLAQQGLRDFVAASAADAGAGVSRYLGVRGPARGGGCEH